MNAGNQESFALLNFVGGVLILFGLLLILLPFLLKIMPRLEEVHPLLIYTLYRNGFWIGTSPILILIAVAVYVVLQLMKR